MIAGPCGNNGSILTLSGALGSEPDASVTSAPCRVWQPGGKAGIVAGPAHRVSAVVLLCMIAVDGPCRFVGEA